MEALLGLGEISHAKSHHTSESRALLGLGYHHLRRGEAGSATDYLEQSLSLARGPGIEAASSTASMYGSGARRLRLYVNGALAGQATGTIWNAGGPFMIGAAKSGGQVSNHFPGGVDHVRAYDRALSDFEVRELHRTPPPVLYDHWKFDEGSGTVARSSEGRKTSATLQGGASWDTAGVSGGGVRLNGTSAFVEMPARAIPSTDSFTVTGAAARTLRLSSGSAGFFAGAIDDVRAYGGALSDGEIRALGTATR
jgi:hypothetical protein